MCVCAFCCSLISLLGPVHAACVQTCTSQPALQVSPLLGAPRLGVVWLHCCTTLPRFATLSPSVCPPRFSTPCLPWRVMYRRHCLVCFHIVPSCLAQLSRVVNACLSAVGTGHCCQQQQQECLQAGCPVRVCIPACTAVARALQGPARGQTLAHSHCSYISLGSSVGLCQHAWDCCCFAECLGQLSFEGRVVWEARGQV